VVNKPVPPVVIMKVLMVVLVAVGVVGAMPQARGPSRRRQVRGAVLEDVSQAALPTVRQQREVLPTVRLQREVLSESREIVPQPYSFALDVSDDDSTNYQSRTEAQDEEGVVRGQYSYVAPNGVRITVTYTADAINGYQATLTEEPTDIVIRQPERYEERSDSREVYVS